MRSFRTTVLSIVLLAAQTACADHLTATGPDGRTPGAPSLDASLTRTTIVTVRDECDSASFNAAFGPGTCVRPRGVLFQKFLQQVQTLKFAPGWRFDPVTTFVGVGRPLLAVNRGGEVHTFTEVAHFGGGIVPMLNTLSGNPVPAPECLALVPSDFVPPGAPDTPDEVGTELYQCCIHPWMRMRVHVVERIERRIDGASGLVVPRAGVRFRPRCSLSVSPSRRSSASRSASSAAAGRSSRYRCSSTCSATRRSRRSP